MSASLSFDSFDPSVRKSAERLLAAFAAAGGKAFVVGGAVRDALLGGTPKDLDIEVYGLDAEAMEKVIAAVEPFDTVGRSFGVFKLKRHAIDISLPRRESKLGTGHKGFAVEGDPAMSFAEACARRDFTINAILWNPSEGLIDPFDGQKDLAAHLLRHTSEHFAEDPLRVLRAMQFAARFDFEVARETVELCSRMTPEGLPAERLWEEWKKLILKGRTPSRGLNFLRACGWVKYYPELAALIGCPQDPEWHPEGDVWNHTLHCLDAFARAKTRDEWEDLVVGFAVLCHDLGKPATTEFIDGHYRSRGHDTAGVAVAERFLRRMTAHEDFLAQVLPLVDCHMRPRELYECKAGDAAIRRLARKVVRIDRLVRVAQADMFGRPPMPTDFPEGDWLLAQAERLKVADAAPKSIILGRHLVALGYAPSVAFKAVLEAAYEAQLDGAFADLDGGQKWLDGYLKEKPIKA